MNADTIYLDNHATTPMDPRVVEAMLPFFTKYFGNPGSIGHAFGDAARTAVESSREEIAHHLNVAPNEVVFTSGATESNNLAIKGIADRSQNEKGHFLSVTTEHKAVLDPLARLEKSGFDVALLSPTEDSEEQSGQLPVDLDQLRDGIKDETLLVSVMLANNEIGVIQPLKEIAAVCHQRGVPLHSDATQAIGKLPVDVNELDVDLMSLSGHKIYGPRGIGALIVRRRRPRIRLLPLIEGGGQEHGRRSGTLNVPGIVGLATALRLCVEELEAESARVRALRDRLHSGIQAAVDGVALNGPDFANRLDGNLNLRFDGVDGEALMMNMDQIAVSSGSACTSANPEPSHVLRAIGLTEDQTRSSLRFGIGRFNTEQDIDLAVTVVATAVNRLRSMGTG